MDNQIQRRQIKWIICKILVSLKSLSHEFALNLDEQCGTFLPVPKNFLCTSMWDIFSDSAKFIYSFAENFFLWSQHHRWTFISVWINFVHCSFNFAPLIFKLYMALLFFDRYHDNAMQILWNLTRINIVERKRWKFIGI